MSHYQGKFAHEELSIDGKISMKKIYKEHIVTSDWIFIKNIANETVEMIVLDEDEEEMTITVKPDETTRVYFGIYC